MLFSMEISSITAISDVPENVLFLRVHFPCVISHRHTFHGTYLFVNMVNFAKFTSLIQRCADYLGESR